MLCGTDATTAGHSKAILGKRVARNPRTEYLKSAGRRAVVRCAAACEEDTELTRKRQRIGQSTEIVLERAEESECADSESDGSGTSASTADHEHPEELEKNQARDDEVPCKEFQQDLPIIQILSNDEDTHESRDKLFHETHSPSAMLDEEFSDKPHSGLQDRGAPPRDHESHLPRSTLTENLSEQSQPESAEKDLTESDAPPTSAAAENMDLKDRLGVHIVKWVDLSKKYGIGYTLSDKSIGVLFKDSTRIHLAPNYYNFDYVTRRTPGRIEQRTHHTLDPLDVHSPDMTKKVTLLRSLKKYLLTDSLAKRHRVAHGESRLHLKQPLEQGRELRAFKLEDAVSVKKWARKKEGVFFNFNNNDVQVIFKDKTEFLLSSGSHTIAYVNTDDFLLAYDMNDVRHALPPNCEGDLHDLTKRLRYTNDVLALRGETSGTA